MSERPWDHYADWWVDGFTNGADPEYAEQILPLAAGELLGYHDVLDVGCGEGQIARLMSAIGATRVVGVEPSAHLLAVARGRAGGPEYVDAQVESLPFADCSFDAVVCCLVLEHVVALDRAVGEIARVLRPGGRLALFLNHPLLLAPDSGWILDDGADPPRQYWRLGGYLGEATRAEELDDGIFVPLVHRPLSRYVNALIDSGLAIEHMAEPAPAPGFVARHPALVGAPAIPRLLYLRAQRRVLR